MRDELAENTPAFEFSGVEPMSSKRSSRNRGNCPISKQWFETMPRNMPKWVFHSAWTRKPWVIDRTVDALRFIAHGLRVKLWKLRTSDRRYRGGFTSEDGHPRAMELPSNGLLIAFHRVSRIGFHGIDGPSLPWSFERRFLVSTNREFLCARSCMFRRTCWLPRSAHPQIPLPRLAYGLR